MAPVLKVAILLLKAVCQGGGEKSFLMMQSAECRK